MENNEIECLQGRVKVPTGGIVRERLRLQNRLDSGTDSYSLDERRCVEIGACFMLF